MEPKSDMPLATAIMKHGKLQSETADSSVVPDVPFTMDITDREKMIM